MDSSATHSAGHSNGNAMLRVRCAIYNGTFPQVFADYTAAERPRLGFDREIVVHDLQFLKAKDVRLLSFEKRDKPRFAHAH